MTVSSNSHLKVKKSLGESLHCFASLCFGMMAHHVRCKLPSYTPNEWMWIITRSAFVHLPNKSILIFQNFESWLLNPISFFSNSSTTKGNKKGNRSTLLPGKGIWDRWRNNRLLLQMLCSLETSPINSNNKKISKENNRHECTSPEWSKLLGPEITAALLDMLAGWQNSPDENVGHKLHSLREERDSWRRTANSSSTTRRKSYNSLFLSSRTTICILQALPSMVNISIFSRHLQHELKNCKKKIQNKIYWKKKKELHFAFLKRFLQWRPSPSSAHTQHELKNLKGTQQKIYCKKKKELHFAFFRPFLQWRRKTSSQKHEGKECNTPQKNPTL